MTNELAPYSPATVDAAKFFNADQLDLIKKQIAPKATPDELKLFLYQAARTGLDPMSRQIYCIHRQQWDAERNAKVNKMTIQTSIDGFRLIAERTERYAPGREATFEYDKSERLNKATAYVMKCTRDGKWHEVAASAYFLEYAQFKADKTLTQMWQDKPHIMLSKCAEALALRKAFPAEMSGLYTNDEMSKDSEPSYTPPEAAKATGPKGATTSIASASTDATQKTHAGDAQTASLTQPRPSKATTGAETDREPGSDDGDEETDDPNDRVECLKWEKSSDSWVVAGYEPRRTEAQNRKFHALLRECKITDEVMHGRIINLFGKDSSKNLSVREMASLIDKMETRVSKGHTPAAKEERWKRDGFVKNEATGTWSDPNTGEVASG